MSYDELKQKHEEQRERVERALGTTENRTKPATATERAHWWSVEAANQKARADSAEAENAKLRKQAAESTQLLELAYHVYRDVGGKIGDNYIFSLGEWLQWLPYQTDDYLDVEPTEVQP